MTDTLFNMDGDGDESALMSYEDFFSAADVAVYKRVKRGSMQLARVARSVIADMVNGNLIQYDDSRKEYLNTKLGVFRLAMSTASDNQTEMREHSRLGAEVVVIGDPEQMKTFFHRHGHAFPEQAVRRMRARIHEELNQ